MIRYIVGVTAAIVLAATVVHSQQQILVPTRPAGDNTNAAASTAFVQNLAPLNILAFGADPTNTNDNATALNNALAALSGTQRCIRFPAGKYKFLSSVSFNIPAGFFAVCILGDGQDNTILTWPSAAGGITFNYTGLNSSVHIRDVSFTTGTTAGGNAVTLSNATSNANPAVTAISDFYRVGFRGDDGYSLTDYWTTAVNIANVSNIIFDNISINGASTPNGIGINLVGLPGSSTFGVAYNVAKSTFNNLQNGIVYGSFIQGLTVDQSNFTSNAGTSSGISVLSSQTGALTQLAVTNSQFNVPTNAIGLSTAVADVMLTNNLCIARANSNCFSLGNVTNFNVVANQLQASSVTGTNAVVVGGSATLGTITGNAITGFAAGITIQANATIVAASGNELASNTTNVINNSGSVSNGGFDLPSIAFTPSYTCGTATFTNNSSLFKAEGKLTWAEVDVTIATIGSCTNLMTFTLPNTSNSGSTIIGQESANVTNPRDTVVCVVGGGTATATCVKQTAHAFAATDHFIASGTYENR